MTCRAALLKSVALRPLLETVVPPKKAKKDSVARNRRRVVSGIVTSDKMQKTIKVQIERHVQHPMFGKTLRRYYSCYAHDEKGDAHTGDKVELMETRPMSRLKHWRLVRIISRAAGSQAAVAAKTGEKA